MTQQNISINGSVGLTKEHSVYNEKRLFARSFCIWLLSIIEIPIMLLTLFALCFLIKSHHAAPVYVIQLILSDVIQIICTLLSTKWESAQLDGAFIYCLIVGLYFMACVAFERYLLVSHPHWYKSRHSLKLSCFISLVVWFVPLIFADIKPNLYFRVLPRCIACFIPYPIIILCFVGTYRGLSHSISLTSHKRKLILGSLFLVLLTYTCLIFPVVVMSFIVKTMNVKRSLKLRKVSYFLTIYIYLNPIADCLLYLFMRADVGDIMKSIQCCCRTDRHNNSTQHCGTDRHQNQTATQQEAV